ncbi:MAG: histidine phosphatase family protein [Methylomonas sp.]|nr:histidine phosphatase family protein [Methylomonas sp.]
MLITCLRHATAEDYTPASTDAERALVKKGRDQVGKVAEFCRKNSLAPGVLLTSPLLRAKQTAKLLASRLPQCDQPQLVDWLAAGANSATIIAELGKLEVAGVNDVWLVGHEPDISALIARLIDADNDCILIKKASLTRLDASFEPVKAQLLWSIPCAMMRS